MSVPEYLVNARHDDPFPQVQPPGGCSLMNHKAAAGNHATKEVPPWPP